MNISETIVLSPKQKGNITELRCLAAFYELGYGINVPYGDNASYDFVVDINGKLLKVQAKTCRSLDDGNTISFSCRNTHVNSKGVHFRNYTKDEVDFFCTYYDEKCYLVPIEDCGREKRLRLLPTKNSQKSKINYAKDYELSVQIQKILNKDSLTNLTADHH